MRNINPKVWVALLFAALTLVGLMVSPDYGLPCDEPAEQVILQENLHEYAIRLGGAGSEAARYYAALGVNRISQSIERDHGQSAYYLAAPLLVLLRNAPNQLLVAWHAYTWLWFMAGVIALYLLMRALGLSRPLAFATALLLYLAPRFFAEGHYNNKDVVLLSLTLLTLAFGARFYHKPTFWRALPFALMGAMAANTKIAGAFAFALVGLATLVSLTARRALTRGRLLAGLGAIVMFLGFYALLTPALWADPLGYLRYVLGNAAGFSRWTGVVLFRGAIYDPTRGLPLPRSYLPVMVLLTTPLPYLLLAAVGQIAALLLCLRRDPARPLLLALTLLWLVPVAYVMAARPLLYNGWRHFYFIYAGIAAMGGLGMRALANLTQGRKRLQSGMAAALAALFLWQGAGIALNHPYQYAYYNLMAHNAEQDFELDYWDVSVVNAMRALAALGPGSGAPLALGASDELSLFGVEKGYPSLTAAEKASLAVTRTTDAPYMLYNTTYARIYGVSPPAGYAPIVSLNSYGREICVIYAQQ